MAIFRGKSTLLKEEHWQMARAKWHFLPGGRQGDAHENMRFITY